MTTVGAKSFTGTAINGWMPKTTLKVDKRYTEFEHIRFTLKNAWNTVYKSQLANNKLKKSIITPFRAVNNAGDLLARNNYSCGGSCQSFQNRPQIKGLKQKFGTTSNLCIPSVIYNSLQAIQNIPSATCNVKYVYDSSDYTRYLKEKAFSKNYNDFSYGGDSSNASQSTIKAIKRK
jgi:hypothetical protein